jgi:hypothetical protein
MPFAASVSMRPRQRRRPALNERDNDVAALKSDMVLMKWMMGFVLAFQVAIFARLFFQ